MRSLVKLAVNHIRQNAAFSSVDNAKYTGSSVFHALCGHHRYKIISRVSAHYFHRLTPKLWDNKTVQPSAATPANL
jgi:hypothetical protein